MCKQSRCLTGNQPLGWTGNQQIYMHGLPVFAPNLNFNRYGITLNNLLSAMDDFQSKQLANLRNGRRTYLVTYSLQWNFIYNSSKIQNKYASND